MTKTPGRFSSRFPLLTLLLAVSLPARFAFGQGCPTADLNRDGKVSGADISVLLGQWGTNGGTTGADLNGSGAVTGADLAIVLEQWGQACPPVTTPSWATLVEAYPDPNVVTSATLRNAITATGRAWRVRDTRTQIEMLLIPPGTFQMGCSASITTGCFSNESPKRQVTLTNAFYIGRYEVTQQQWRVEMGYNNSFFRGSAYPESTHPVERVSWNEISNFNFQTGMRLPTEAEWEFAYRAGTDTAFHGFTGYLSGTNSDALVTQIAWIYGNAAGQTRPIGQKLANGFGLHDMSGNVWEWVNDWYGTYPSSAQTNPAGPASGTSRVIRGGSWGDVSDRVRSSYRYDVTPGDTDGYLGFRVARTP